MRPSSRSRRVVLPAPDGPVTATRRCAGMARSTPASACPASACPQRLPRQRLPRQRLHVGNRRVLVAERYAAHRQFAPQGQEGRLRVSRRFRRVPQTVLDGARVEPGGQHVRELLGILLQPQQCRQDANGDERHHQQFGCVQPGLARSHPDQHRERGGRADVEDRPRGRARAREIKLLAPHVAERAGEVPNVPRLRGVALRQLQATEELRHRRVRHAPAGRQPIAESPRPPDEGAGRDHQHAAPQQHAQCNRRRDGHRESPLREGERDVDRRLNQVHRTLAGAAYVMRQDV